MLECNVIVNKLVKGSFVIIVIGKGSLLSDTVGGAWVSSTCTVFAYTEHLRAGADPGGTAASTATSEHPSSMAGVRESPSGSSATTF